MTDNSNDVVVVSAVRSAVARGKRGGALSATHAVEVSAQVMKQAIERSGVDVTQIDHFFGAVIGYDGGGFGRKS